MPKVSSPSADASGTEDKGDAKQRVIKKYPNRRLYDTRSSSYVTLAEIKRLIIDHVPVVVRDAKTNEDLTRSIFLQIILEEEAGGAPMFDEAVLAQMIRFHGHAMQGFLGPYLEKNMQTMMELQARFAEQVAGPNPQPWPTMLGLQANAMPAVWGQYAEQSKAMFSQMQEKMQKHLQQQTQQMLDAMGVKK
jgi:polyhydroxyalkanoate synthesis repressor PhaR